MTTDTGRGFTLFLLLHQLVFLGYVLLVPLQLLDLFLVQCKLFPMNGILLLLFPLQFNEVEEKVALGEL